MLLIACGIISYILSSRQDYGTLIDEPFRVDFGAWFPLMNLLRNSLAAWFMLICHAIFRDTEAVPRPLLALIVLQLFLEEPLGWMIGEDWAPPVWTVLVHEVIPALIQLVYLALGIFWTLSESDADLDETRRKARIYFIALYTSQAVLSLLIERVAMAYQWVPLGLPISHPCCFGQYRRLVFNVRLFLR